MPDLPSPPAAPPLPELSREETLRYARHLVLPEVGEEGQRKLKNARVLCVGAGGLGSPLALYLAAAGVGTLGLVDFDEVDATNLQRQILHGTKDVGRSKLDSAAERLADVNPHVEVVPHRTRLTSANALEILEPYDVVVDGTDNFPTRYLVNDACVLLGKPNIYGSIFRWEGQVSVFGAPEGWEMRFPERDGIGGRPRPEGDRGEPGHRAGRGDGAPGSGRSAGPCYRCLFRQPPPPGLVPNCAEGGVLGVLPGVIGSLQAMETIKWILGRGDPLVGRLQIFDALAMQWREVALRRNPECPVCGDEPTQEGLIDYEVFCGVAPGDEVGPAVRAIEADELAARLGGDRPPFLLDVREPWEWRVGNLESRGAVLVPLRELEERIEEVRERVGDDERDVVVYCRSGGRSADAARQLARAGLGRVHNLRGGLKAWAVKVDPDVEVA